MSLKSFSCANIVNWFSVSLTAVVSSQSSRFSNLINSYWYEKVLFFSIWPNQIPRSCIAIFWICDFDATRDLLHDPICGYGSFRRSLTCIVWSLYNIKACHSVVYILNNLTDWCLQPLDWHTVFTDCVNFQRLFQLAIRLDVACSWILKFISPAGRPILMHSRSVCKT